jgi:hypothetical protein
MGDCLETTVVSDTFNYVSEPPENLSDREADYYTSIMAMRKRRNRSDSKSTHICTDFMHDRGMRCSLRRGDPFDCWG